MNLKLTTHLILLLVIAFLPVKSFAVLTNQIIPIEHQSETPLKISLKALWLRDTEWTIPLIMNEIEKTNKIFLQCGVQIKEINLIQSDYTSTFSDFSDVVSLTENLKKNEIRLDKEVAIIFAGKLDGAFRMMGGEGTGGFSFNRSSLEGASNKEAQSENLAFVLDISHTDEYRSLRNSEYSPLAHELGHVLFNQAHVDYPNLMANSFSRVNTQLTEDQCNSIRAFPFL